MSGREFSQRLRSFVGSYISSVEQADVLLLLRDDPQRAWSAEEISERLRSSRASISGRLRMLTEHRLASYDPDGRCRYAAEPALDALVAEFKDAYERKRYSLIELIFSRPSDPMQSFADAFRFTEGDDDC